MWRTGVAAVVLGSVLLAPGVAHGGSIQTFSGTFTTTAPGSPTGYTASIDYRDPADPQGKPPAVADVIQVLPAGTRIDTEAVERCTAPDPQLLAEGAAACPAGSVIGGGELETDSAAGAGPVPRILESRITFFNAEGEMILFTEATNVSGPPVRTSSRVKIDGTKLSVSVPPVPVPDPDDPFLAIKKVRVGFPAAGTAARPYLRTPESCPASGAWTIAGTFTYRNGAVETDVVPSPCAARAGEGAALAPPRRALVALARPSASARKLNRRRRLGVAVRVDGRIGGVRVRLVDRAGRTVARASAARLARDTVLQLRRVRRARPGIHRVVLTAREAGGGAVRVVRSVRLRR